MADRIKLLYGQRYAPIDLRRIRCMWMLGVPVRVIASVVRRMEPGGIATLAKSRRWRRPEWFGSMIKTRSLRRA